MSVKTLFKLALPLSALAAVTSYFGGYLNMVVVNTLFTGLGLCIIPLIDKA